MNQNSAPAQSLPPMNQQPPQAVPGNTNQLANQIAQLLQQQGRGAVDPSALNNLLKADGGAQPPKMENGGGYATAYPASSSYDMYYNQNNPSNSYGPSKDNADAKRYRPY